MPGIRSVPLRFAYLCLEDDCEAVFPLPTRDQACPACASKSVWPLARWLNYGYKPLTFNENIIKEVSRA